MNRSRLAQEFRFLKKYLHLHPELSIDGWNGFPTRFLWTENWKDELPKEKKS